MYKVHFENRFIMISPEPDRLQKYSLFHKFYATKELYKLIDEAVKTEDYERAASIRDEIEKRKKKKG